MKYNKNIQNKCLRRKYLKTSKSRGCGNISTQFYKNRNKRKWKG